MTATGAISMQHSTPGRELELDSRVSPAVADDEVFDVTFEDGQCRKAKAAEGKSAGRTDDSGDSPQRPRPGRSPKVLPIAAHHTQPAGCHCAGLEMKMIPDHPAMKIKTKPRGGGGRSRHEAPGPSH